MLLTQSLDIARSLTGSIPQRSLLMIFGHAPARVLPRFRFGGAAAIVLISTAVLASCSVSMRPGYVEDDKRTVEKAIDRFHAMYNAGQHQDIYATAHEVFRKSITEDALAAAMKGSRDKYGNVDHVTHRWLNVLIGNPIEVKAVYNTHFEKCDATEEFSWVVDGDKAALALYQIFPGTTPVKGLKEEPLE
jgi:hypothetical protein